MKNLLLCCILVLQLTSCSSDSDFNSIELKENVLKTNGNLSLPQNNANPFDYKGKEYFNALTLYQKENQYPNSVAEISNQLRFIASKIGKSPTTGKLALSGKNIISFNDEIVQSIMADPDNNMISIVDDSSLSSSAKASLISFLQGLISRRQLEFSIIYSYIVDYEDTILDGNTWNQDDRDTILTVASISRYSLYSESERKDRDWESSAGNKPAKTFFSNNEASVISIIAVLDKII